MRIIRLHHVAHADRAAGARAGLDDHRLAERALDMLRDEARRDLDRASRREGDDEPHRAGGPGLPAGKARQQRRKRERGGERASANRSGHGRSSWAAGRLPASRLTISTISWIVAGGKGRMTPAMIRQMPATRR